MRNRESQENEFVQGVWRKVRYLEYKKNEEELVRKKLKRIRMEKFRLLLLILSVLLPATALVLAFIGLNMFSIIVAGILFLSAGVSYEYIRDIKIDRRNLNENCYR